MAEAIPETATFEQRFAVISEAFHVADAWARLNILIGLGAWLFLFCAALVTFYDLSVSAPQRVAVLGLKKRFTKYDRWLRTSIFRYIVSYKNSKGQVVEAPVKIPAMDFIDITHVTVRIKSGPKGDRVKFIDLGQLGSEIFGFILLGTFYSMILYPELLKTDFFPAMWLSLFVILLLFVYLNMRQFVYCDRSIFLLRWWRQYFEPRKFLKKKMSTEEHAALNMPDKLLSYEEARRLHHKDLNDALRPYALPLIAVAFIYVAWEFLRPRG